MSPPIDYPRRLAALFDSMKVKAESSLVIDGTLAAIQKHRARYEAVQRATGVPWCVTGALHHLECSGSFLHHLHNGDPLTARTVQVPRGRPVTGKPPFRWEDSAIDAIQYDGLDALGPGWQSIGLALDKIERYNGTGYRRRGINSPYLWSGSQHYREGKFISDGRFDPSAVSRQIGAAVLLKALVGLGLVSFRT